MTRRECPACGRYCWNRCRHCGYVRPITRKPDHHRRIVMGVRLTAHGTREFKTMSSRKAAWVLGGQKRGLTAAASGKAHRWTSETARKAAIKSWTKRRKFNGRIGARVGMVKNMRKPLMPRAALRAYYAENPTRGITYRPDTELWVRECFAWPGNLTHRPISERAALQALGHLKSPRGYIPDSITLVKNRNRQ